MTPKKATREKIWLSGMALLYHHLLAEDPKMRNKCRSGQRLMVRASTEAPKALNGVISYGERDRNRDRELKGTTATSFTREVWEET